jgi:DNA-binding transcriptional ArsR family regulator
VSKVFRALADPTRRGVLALLRTGPLSAGELASHFDVSKATMSAHFSVLREADLLTSSKSGTTVTYYLNLSVLEEALLEFTSLFGIQTNTDATRGTP